MTTTQTSVLIGLVLLNMAANLAIVLTVGARLVEAL